MTEVQIKHCQELYEEYKILKEKTKLNVQDYVPGKPLKPQHIAPEDIIRKEEIRKKLLERCHKFLKSCLAPDELFEMENS